MPLKLSLKPHEKVFLNGAVVENGGQRADLIIHNISSLLRQKDVMKEEGANTPARRIFYLIQMLYISPERQQERLAVLQEALLDFLVASPSSRNIIAAINKELGELKFYQALQACKRLIEHETGIMDYVSAKGDACIPADSEGRG